MIPFLAAFATTGALYVTRHLLPRILAGDRWLFFSFITLAQWANAGFAVGRVFGWWD